MTKGKGERLKRGWRLEDLAFYARVGVAEISRIETCRMTPYPAHAARLSIVLGLAPDELQQEVEAEPRLSSKG